MTLYIEYPNNANNKLLKCANEFGKVVVVQSLGHVWSLWPHRLRHVRLFCPPLYPTVCLNSCLLSWWCYLTISSSAAPFSSCFQSFPASQSFLVSRLFTSDGQSTGASGSASVLPMSIQGWFPVELTSLISLQSKELKSLLQHHNRKHQFFGTQPSLQFSSHIYSWLLEKS